MKALPPNFELLPVAPADAPELVSVYFAAFQNAHSLTGWPRIPTVRKWWEEMLAHECQDAHSHIFKIVDGSNVDRSSDVVTNDEIGTTDSAPRIVAFGKWNHPRPSVKIDTNLPAWPEGSDKELNQDKFGRLIEKRIAIMGPVEDHWYLELIATHPSYQGRGLGSILMEWGTSRADAEGKECYLEAAAEGLPLYRKYGFAQRNPTTDYVEVDIKGHGLERDLCMVREARIPRTAL